MPAVQITRPAEGIALLTLDRPEKLNALDVTMVTDLYEALDDVGGDRDWRVVVLTGAGRGFCAGLDLGGYGEAPDGEGRGAIGSAFATQQHIAGLVPRLRRLHQPVVDAAIETAALIAGNSPWGVRMTKEVAWSQLEIGSLQAGIDLENRTQILSGQTEDMREAIGAFLSKRPPRFTGR